MSKVTISGNASGTGTLLIAAPNTNSDITLNLPTTMGTNNSSSVVTTDAAGNLGLGVAPSAWGSSTKSIDLNTGGAVYAFASNSVGLTANAFYNGTNWIYKNSSSLASLYTPTNGQHQWFNAPSGTAGAAISFVQAMTLDANGNLAVGGTSFAYAAANRNNIAVNGTSTAFYELQTAGVGRGYLAAGATNIELAAVGYTVFTTNNTERARIDTSGNLLVGRTSLVDFEKFGVEFNTATANGALFRSSSSTAGNMIIFRTASGQLGSITTNGTSSIAYNTNSDYRLKHDIAPMTGALAKVAALKPVTYKWNSDDSDGEGFIAHELAEVCPAAVTGEKDAVDAEGNPQYQGIDVSFLVGTLTAAIKELKAIVDAQGAEIATLKGTA